MRAEFDFVVVILIWIVACLPWLSGSHYVSGDSIQFSYPYSKYVADTVRHGNAPWWNLSTYSGQPLLGDPQSMIFTPHTLAGLIAGRAYTLHMFDVVTLLCLLAGGLAIHSLCRRETHGRTLPILGATVFMIGGAASSRLQHVGDILTYSMLALQICALRSLCERPDMRRLAFLAGTLLVSLVNPNQVVFLSAFQLLAFMPAFLYRSEQRLRTLLLACGAVLLAIVAASPVLAAIVEFSSVSNRPALPIDASSPFSLPFFNVAALIIPALYGVAAPRHGVWPPTDSSEDYIYTGLIPVLVILLIFIRPRRMPPSCVVAAVLSIVWLMYALGTNFPLYPVLHSYLPGLTAFRRPADAAFLLNCSMAIAVGTARWPFARVPLGGAWLWSAVLVSTFALFIMARATMELEHYAASRGQMASFDASLRQLCIRVAILCAGAVSVFILRQRRWRMPAGVLMIGLTATDLTTAGRFSLVFSPRYELSATAQFYAHQVTPYTRQINDALAFLRAHGVMNKNIPTRIEVVGGELGYNMPMVANLEVTGGYNPFNLASYSRNVATQELKRFNGDAPNPQHDIYRRLGVRYVLVSMTNMIAKPEVNTFHSGLARSTSAHLLTHAGEYEVWEIDSWLPKATLIGADGATAGACRVRAYRNTTVRVHCSALVATILVTGDTYAPGWTACVNNAPAPVTAFQKIFRQVQVPAGESDIRLRYQPVPFFRTHGC